MDNRTHIEWRHGVQEVPVEPTEPPPADTETEGETVTVEEEVPTEPPTVEPTEPPAE